MEQPYNISKRVENLNETVAVTYKPKESTLKIAPPVPIPKVIRIPKASGLKRALLKSAHDVSGPKIRKVVKDHEGFARVKVKEEVTDEMVGANDEEEMFEAVFAEEVEEPKVNPVPEDAMMPVIKEEPQEKAVMKTEDAPVIDMSIVKNEPIDEYSIPQFELTEEAYELPQNVVIKEEYELGDGTSVIGFETDQYDSSIPATDPNQDEVRQAIIDAFSSSNELVIKDNIKEKIERKKKTEMRRKTLALSIPQNVNVVKSVLVKQQQQNGEHMQTVKLSKIDIEKASQSLDIDNSRFTKFKCEHCTVVSRSRLLVIKHIKEMHCFSCTVCLQIFPSAYKLTKHKESTHNIQMSEDGGRRKQKLKAIKEDEPANFRLHTKTVDKR